jgi:hypothetical protein
MTMRNRGYKHLLAGFVIAAFGVILCANWTAPRAAAQQQSASSPIVPILARLATPLDSKKKKAGDVVELRTTAAVRLPDETMVPSGAKIVGHVTDAKARSKGDSESSLGIAFDKIEVSRGKSVGITGVIRAVGPNANEQASGGVDYGNSLNMATQRPGGVSGAAPSVMLITEHSVGVTGLKNLSLSSNGTLHSDEKMVKLDNDAQVLIVAKTAAN